MGCGTSTLDAEDSSWNPRSNRVHRHPMVPPVVIDKKNDFENGDKGHVSFLHGNYNHYNNNNNKDFVIEMKPLGYKEAKDINEGSTGERLKEKNVVERNNNINKEEERVFEIGGKEKHSGGDDNHCAKNVEEELEDRDDLFIGPGSPSFREYCNDFDCGGRSSMEDSNDCDSMDQSIKNGSSDDDDLSNKNNKTNKENFNKPQREKKERRGRRFKNVISKGKGKGKGKGRERKNLLNFACYNASNESYAESSFNKIAAKTA